MGGKRVRENVRSTTRGHGEEEGTGFFGCFSGKSGNCTMDGIWEGNDTFL